MDQENSDWMRRNFRLDRDQCPGASCIYVAADAQDGGATTFDALSVPALNAAKDGAWLVDVWRIGLRQAAEWARQRPTPGHPFILAIDEIQRIPEWSSIIKGLWDAMRASSLQMQVVLLGSSPLLVRRGLTESLAGRFEVTHLTHWSLAEMEEAFGVDLNQYVYFGGFPGSSKWLQDEQRWRTYVRDALVGPAIESDILMLTRVDKPALLRRLFELGCLYSGQIVALDKMLGQLTDAGNVTTLARYLELLSDAGLLTGLQKHSDAPIRRRRAPPKLQALNNALVSAQGSHTFAEAKADRSHWGHLFESAMGAHLVNSADIDMQIRYWREGPLEVDFVVEHRGRLAAIEVKSAPNPMRHQGLQEFARRHSGCKVWRVGTKEMPLDEALHRPAASWVDD